jgi:hypothetical protein
MDATREEFLAQASLATGWPDSLSGTSGTANHNLYAGVGIRKLVPFVPVVPLDVLSSTSQRFASAGLGWVRPQRKCEGAPA